MRTATLGVWVHPYTGEVRYCCPKCKNTMLSSPTAKDPNCPLCETQMTSMVDWVKAALSRDKVVDS